MGLFSNLKSDDLEETEDRLGGFQPFVQDIYEADIKLAYAGVSSGGAQSVTIVSEIDGREHRETFYVTNKKGENFYLNKNDKTKKVPLPGYNVVNDICLVTTEKELAEQETEEKVVKIYDYDAKTEVPKTVDVLTGLIGQKVYLAISNSLVNKTEKVGDEYVPTADTRVENTVDKVFHYPSKLSVVEARKNLEPTFFDAWRDRNQGNQRDRRDIKDGQAGAPRSGRPTAGAPAAGNTAAPKSLFGTKS